MGRQEVSGQFAKEECGDVSHGQTASPLGVGERVLGHGLDGTTPSSELRRKSSWRRGQPV